ncbi:GTP cyclohydrolase II, partial [Pseudokineococcus sp. 1T1Z-3]|uniref:GTP cyclohydrolase II n=1 Tax=Pseudokineococcus sp. 1T1Z-3 TaxID=3132745 RepID=UPI0030AD8F5C
MTAPSSDLAYATFLPTAHGTFTLHGFRAGDGTEHVALVLGDPSDAAAGPPLVRVHSECLTGDALGSWRCDCGDQLDAALRAVAAEGRGVVVYLRGQEGRGIGLLAKVKAYALQDAGADTVDANTALGLPVDAREYGTAAAVLSALGVPSVRLMTSNPAKAAALEAAGVEVAEVVGLLVPDRPTSAAYRRTKVERLGHLPVAAAGAASASGPWDALVAAAHGGAPLPTAGEGPGTAGGDLLDRYAPLAAGGVPLVVAQVAQSLDGFTAARSGDARYVSGPADREHLHRLRALVDVVVVGVRTVAADDPLLTVRACPGPHPVRAVLDPMGRAPLGATLFGDPTAPVLWLVGATRAAAAAAAVADRPHVEVVPLTGCTSGEDVVGAVIAALAARGLHRVLVEGGATTVSRFLAAGALDRLWVTTAPVLVGDGVPG